MEPKEQIRERIDVVDLVSEYLQLKPAGQGAFKVCCPFHGEKTPSFYVNRQKQIWHCFGCDKGGDIFAFLMEMEGVDFPEALQLLGRKAGVEIPKYEKKGDDRRARMRAINGFAQKVFEKYLAAEKGASTRKYLENRGIDSELAAKFGLGYAPDSWTALVDVAKKKGIAGNEMIEAGVALRSKGKSDVVDRFRNRLMVPLRDHHGNTVGFTGRVLDPNDNPKYMNSPQTAVYDKSALLYGLDLAKTAIKVEKAVVVVEGNLDVVASHKAGVENVVGSSGTALTERQLRLLKRYTNTLIFSFDADAAGFEAARRGMRLATSLGLEVRVAPIPADAGKDPDDVVQKDPELWRKTVNEHVDKMQYFFDRLVGPARAGDLASIAEAKREFLPEIASLSEAVARDHWLKKMAGWLDVSIESLKEDMGKAGTSKSRSTSRPQDTEEIEATKVSHDKLLDLLLSTVIASRENAQKVLERVTKTSIEHPMYKKLYESVEIVYNSAKSSQKKSFFEAVRTYLGDTQPELVKEIDRLALIQEQYADASSTRDLPTLDTLIGRLLDRSQKQAREEVLASIRRAEIEGDKERVTELMRQYQSLL